MSRGYNSLRDRHGSSVGTAPISFVKTGEHEYRSRDGLWVIKHRYKKGYQATPIASQIVDRLFGMEQP